MLLRSVSLRVYVTKSAWPEFRQDLVKKIELIEVGDPENFENFINPVIHEQSFNKLAAVDEKARSDPQLTFLAVGKISKEIGFYVHPLFIKPSTLRTKSCRLSSLGLYPRSMCSPMWNEKRSLSGSTQVGMHLREASLRAILKQSGLQRMPFDILLEIVISTPRVPDR